MCKIWYTYFIENDYLLLNKETGKSCKVQNISILEELAEIKYLFCDKTGTLTKNELKFKEAEIKKGVEEEFIRCVLVCHDLCIINEQISGASQDELTILEAIQEISPSKLISRDT